jgi:hypothetical protein
VRHDRHDVQKLELVEGRLGGGRNQPRRELHEEVPRAVQRRQRPGGPLLHQLHDVRREPELAPRQHRGRPAEEGVQLQDELVARGGVVVDPVLAQDVRRGHDRLHAVGRRRPAERERLVPPRWSVVDPGETMEVELDHVTGGLRGGSKGTPGSLPTLAERQIGGHILLARPIKRPAFCFSVAEEM